jgi:histidyl-tRNA synthetase
VFAVAQDDASRMDVLRLVDRLRRGGLAAEMDLAERSMKAQMKAASARGARYACIIGEDERSGGVVMLKDLSTAEQRKVPLDALVEEILGADPEKR